MKQSPTSASHFNNSLLCILFIISARNNFAFFSAFFIRRISILIIIRMDQWNGKCSRHKEMLLLLKNCLQHLKSVHSPKLPSDTETIPIGFLYHSSYNKSIAFSHWRDIRCCIQEILQSPHQLFWSRKRKKNFIRKVEASTLIVLQTKESSMLLNPAKRHQPYYFQ